MKTATGNNEEKGMFPEITQKEKKAKRKAEMQENFYTKKWAINRSI